MKLTINNVNKAYEKYEVLKNLSLELNEGTIFGLVGVNGAGKSTLLKSIAGVMKTDSGTITFDGHDTYYDDQIRKDIFMVSDDPYFASGATISSLKAFYETFYSLDEEAYRRYLLLFKLDENQSLNSFSKGMKRLAFLIFALAIKPKLLLLDEAFDGLDPLVRVHIKQALSDLIEDDSSIIIISSHNLKELDDICDSFGILEAGRVDTYGDLLASKANINRYQLAYQEEIDESLFAEFDILHKMVSGRVITLVIRGDRDDITERLARTNPLILDILNINFEELFIYEHEGRIN